MKELNKLRLLAGIPINSDIEKTIKVEEARTVPQKREHLAEKNEKTLTVRSRQLQSALQHIKQAIKALEKIPPLDFTGDIPHFIHELEYIVAGDDGESGLTAMSVAADKELKKFTQEQKKKFEAENEELLAYEDEELSMEDEEEEDRSKHWLPWVRKAMKQQGIDPSKAKLLAATAEEFRDRFMKEGYPHKPQHVKDNLFRLGDTNIFYAIVDDYQSLLKEGAHYYNDAYPVSHETDENQPINVTSQGKSQDVWSDLMDPKNTKDESPEQLDALGPQSDTEHTGKFKVPSKVKAALKDEIAQAKSYAERTSNKEAKIFYANLANAFQRLLDHLEKGTIEEFKKAQVFWSSLMGPMLHKVPKVVSDFIVNGGERKSLKDYMKEVK